MILAGVEIEDNEATVTFGDWAAQATWWTLGTFFAIWLLTLILAIIAAKKAGFSGWWGAFVVLIPVLGPIIALFLVVLPWPALKERDEAIDLLEAKGVALPSRERKALKAQEKQDAIDAEARRNVEAAKANAAAPAIADEPAPVAKADSGDDQA